MNDDYDFGGGKRGVFYDGPKFICTPENVWSPEKTADIKPVMVLHPAARVIDAVLTTSTSGFLVRQCPLCNFRWEEADGDDVSK